MVSFFSTHSAFFTAESCRGDFRIDLIADDFGVDLLDAGLGVGDNLAVDLLDNGLDVGDDLADDSQGDDLVENLLDDESDIDDTLVVDLGKVLGDLDKVSFCINCVDSAVIFEDIGDDFVDTDVIFCTDSRIDFLSRNCQGSSCCECRNSCLEDCRCVF